jgi:hypothetical protein
VVEGSSLENCRRCEPFVSSNLTASAKKQKSAALGRLFVSWRKRAGRLRAMRVRFEGLGVLCPALSESPICSSPAGELRGAPRARLVAHTFAVLPPPRAASTRPKLAPSAALPFTLLIPPRAKPAPKNRANNTRPTYHPKLPATGKSTPLKRHHS